MMNKDLVNYKNLFISKPLMEISLTWRCIIGWDSYMFFKRVTPLKNYPQNGAKIFFVRLKLMTVQAGQQGKPGYLPIIELTCYNLMYCVHSLPLSLSLPPLYTFLNKKILGYEVVSRSRPAVLGYKI